MRRDSAAWQTGSIAAILIAGCYVSEAPPPTYSSTPPPAQGTQAPPQQTGQGRVVRDAPQPQAAGGPAAQAGVRQQTEAPSPEPPAANAGTPRRQAGMSGAQELSIGTEVTGTITEDEPVWYQFEAAHGQRLNVTAYGQCAEEVERCRTQWAFTIVDPLRGRHHHRNLQASKQPDFHRGRFSWSPPLTSTYYLRLACRGGECENGPVSFKLQTEMQREERDDPSVWWDAPGGEPLAGGGEGQATSFTVGQQMLGGTVGPDAPVFYTFEAEDRNRLQYRVWVNCADDDVERCRSRLSMTFLDSEDGRVGHRRLNAHEPPGRQTQTASWRARGTDTYTLRLECQRCDDSGPVEYVILTRGDE